ncbi:MAG: hypothetical protein HY054_13885 [Proteobacteria bacterium]|nr:hypothetical protein [Pseudomonadota bacterium]
MAKERVLTMVGATLMASACALLAMLAPNVAVGQTSSADEPRLDWRESGGRFGLSYRANGWTAVQNGSDFMLFLLRNDAHDGRVPMCSVRSRPQSGAGGWTQEQANQQIGGTADNLERNSRSAHLSPSVTMIGAVAVLSLTGQDNGSDVITRAFALPEQSGFSMYFVSCTAPTPLTSDERVNMNAVLNSLTMLQRANIQPMPAAAPRGEWLDPTGRFTLRYSGWTPVQPQNPITGEVLSLEFHRDQVSGSPVLLCKVTERPVAGASQAAANARLEQLGDADVTRMFPGALNIRHDRLGEMPVVSFDQNTGPLEMDLRLFVVATGASATSVIVGCGGAPPFNDAERASLAAVLGSLEFTAEPRH